MIETPESCRQSCWAAIVFCPAIVTAASSRPGRVMTPWSEGHIEVLHMEYVVVQLDSISLALFVQFTATSAGQRGRISLVSQHPLVSEISFLHYIAIMSLRIFFHASEMPQDALLYSSVFELG